MKVTTVTHRGLFRSRQESTQEQVARPMDGWILLVDPSEGWAQCATGPLERWSTVEGFEEGRFLMLSTGGQLLQAKYVIHLRIPAGAASRETHDITNIEVATADQVVAFDRLNRAYCRETRSGRTGGRRDYTSTEVAWRSELGRRWQVKVPHDGMEASLALKRFKEQGSYIGQLQIKF